jgi:hypothetical protein
MLSHVILGARRLSDLSHLFVEGLVRIASVLIAITYSLVQASDPLLLHLEVRLQGVLTVMLGQGRRRAQSHGL